MSAKGIRGTQLQDNTLTTNQISNTAGITDAQLANGTTYFKKDGSVTATANFNLGGYQATNGAAGVNPTDFIIKSQLDAAILGLDTRDDAIVVATTNVALTGLLTIDGVTLTDGQRVLPTAQTTGSQNGPWLAHSGAWTRPTDYASGSSQPGGIFMVVQSGSVNAGTMWILGGSANITVDTTSTTWTQLNPPTSITAGNGINKSGNTVSAVADPNQGLQVISAGIGVKVDPATGNVVAVSSAGTKLTVTSGQFVVGNSANVGASVAMSGDVTITNAGAATVNMSGLLTNHRSPSEVPTGSINGSNVTFTLGHTPVTGGQEDVFKNGVKQLAGSGNDYSISGATITFASAPLANDSVVVTYWY